MSGVSYPLPPKVLGVQAAARSLRVVIGIGRSDLRVTGAVQPSTWDAIDALTDQLIELLPPRPPRRV